jgi:hypothetical protein
MGGRYAITREPEDELAVMMTAASMDSTGRKWSGSAPTFFRRSSAEVCKAITAPNDRHVRLSSSNTCRGSPTPGLNRPFKGWFFLIRHRRQCEPVPICGPVCRRRGKLPGARLPIVSKHRSNPVGSKAEAKPCRGDARQAQGRRTCKPLPAAQAVARRRTRPLAAGIPAEGRLQRDSHGRQPDSRDATVGQRS